MKRIFWLTGASFFDVDENLVPILNKSYSIYWFVLRQKESFYSKTQIENHMLANGVEGKVVEWPKLRSVKSLYMYYKLVNEIKSSHYDLVYIDFLGIPYMFPLFHLMGLDKNKIVYACHDFLDHVGIKNRGFISRYKSFIFSHFKHIQFFSKTQQKLFLETHTNNTFYAPLALKGFGQPTVQKGNGNPIVFLFFGKIQSRKGLSFLLEATEMIDEKYSGKYIVKICGGCSDWQQYQDKIKHSERFDLNIRRIENDEIANLFATSDYLILPYREVTQSGPLLISYYYNLPVIASRHDGFMEYVEHGETGYLFENENSEDLARIMTRAIENHVKYSNIKSSLSKYIKKNISLEIIAGRYKSYFDTIFSD